MNRAKKYKNINTIIFAFYLTRIISYIILSDNTRIHSQVYRVIKRSYHSVQRNANLDLSEKFLPIFQYIYRKKKIIVDNSCLNHLSQRVTCPTYIYTYILRNIYIFTSVDNKSRVILKSTKGDNAHDLFHIAAVNVFRLKITWTSIRILK